MKSHPCNLPRERRNGTPGKVGPLGYGRSRVQLEALRSWDSFTLVPMFVDATTNPAPSIRGRVSCIRHVRAGVKTPSRILLITELAATAKNGPDGIGAAPVSWMVLYVGRINQREHCPGVAVDHEGAVKLVGPLGCLLDGYVGVRLADRRRRPQAAEVLSLVEWVIA